MGSAAWVSVCLPTFNLFLYQYEYQTQLRAGTRPFTHGVSNNENRYSSSGRTTPTVQAQSGQQGR